MNRKWYHSKLNPFGNYDEPEPPKSYRPELTGWRRELDWWVRNPFHNFDFHWVGINKDKILFTSGDFLGTGPRLSFVHTRYLSFPAISFRGRRIEFYIGWRPNGAFGRAVRVANSKGAGEL